MSYEEGSTELKHAEDLWIDHCEDFLRRGWTPRRWKDLPEYIKTERMKKYYAELKRRIEARDQEK
ncbi:hypothetical protein QMM42_13025 [Leptospira santarosai]|uniref:Uncharacterized protein n=1 Tax=Leptospira santarosai serovar Arenal str. MAVJ 401 TaxID=1049976 RepID=M6K629_9LEPT|nr:hypothetical protein [Leptospira santarosai]EMN23172.1 hypothetical protein LEP1GSC063_2659 [Leptospira santarosai serovar Arenal str. MAVJ 401]MDI7187124.1 hypothetical protein [Leptospira santarosai]MDI7225536.1 hypothetical protein [Leptospira santarosai]MDO6395330.1 hypothetical protein [Leptospira santarosai]